MAVTVCVVGTPPSGVVGVQSWPVVVTNTCADLCAREFGLADREVARAWLYDMIAARGRITPDLPPPMGGRRSPSGYFCLVEGMLVLPLAADREGRAQWIATGCVVFPGYRRTHGVAADVDPFALTGVALLQQVNFTEHAVRRFQERCAAHPNPAVALQQLIGVLAPDALAVRRPPAWCKTQRADFYLVADDAFCLPMSRHGSAGKAFDAKTCMHRASDLFHLTGRALAAKCRYAPDLTTPNGERLDPGDIDRMFAGGRLSWDPPRWAPAHSEAAFWVVFSDRLAAPVAWDADSDRPLIVLGLAERRSRIRRLMTRLRRNSRT